MELCGSCIGESGAGTGAGIAEEVVTAVGTIRKGSSWAIRSRLEEGRGGFAR